MSIAELTYVRGARKAIPNQPGYYAFVAGKRRPLAAKIDNDPHANVLYLRIATQQRGLYGRLSSYLKASVKPEKAEKITHEGKRRLSFARINGVTGTTRGAATNLEVNDKFIHLCWANLPIALDGEFGEQGREYAFLLERALIAYYQPIYNTANWELDLEFDLDDDIE